MFLKKLLVVWSLFLALMALAMPIEAKRQGPNVSKSRPRPVGRLTLSIGSKPDRRVGKAYVAVVPNRGYGFGFWADDYPAQVVLTLAQGKKYQVWATLYDRFGNFVSDDMAEFKMGRVQHVTLNPPSLFRQMNRLVIIAANDWGSRSMETAWRVGSLYDHPGKAVLVGKDVTRELVRASLQDLNINEPTTVYILGNAYSWRPEEYTEIDLNAYGIRVTVDELNEWLGDPGTGMTIVLDGINAGSLVTRLSRPGRVIVSGAGEFQLPIVTDEAPRAVYYFSTSFAMLHSVGFTPLGAYNLVANAIAGMVRDNLVVRDPEPILNDPAGIAGSLKF